MDFMDESRLGFSSDGEVRLSVSADENDRLREGERNALGDKEAGRGSGDG
jgi:hypothetical protein